MSTRITAIVASIVAAASASAPAGAQSGWIVWSQPQNTTYAIVPSYASAAVPMDVEVADDFEVNGQVRRIVVSGYDCFNCAQPDVAGAIVRFYAWTASGPGAMLSETFVADDSQYLQYSVGYPASLDITLPAPFVASGRHFISVQLTFNDAGSWYWWITNNNAPQGSGALTRNRLSGPNAPWTTPDSGIGPLNCDVPLLLWGDDGHPPPPGTDPCGDWGVVAVPNPGQTSHAILRAVHAIASDDVWAVGEYTSTLNGSLVMLSMAMHWDGSAWTHVVTPNPSACPECTSVEFDAVNATSSTDVWAAGSKRVVGLDGFLGWHLYVARFNGTAWTVMNTPLTGGGSGSYVQDIEIISPNDIWFFGDWMSPSTNESYRALAMHWNGSTFTVTPTPFPSGGTPGWGLEAGSAIAPDDIWAVGGGSDGDYSASGYVIHWNGSTWTRVPSPAPGTYQRLYDIKAIASDDVWAVGDYFVAGQGYFPLFIHWDGSSWTQVTSPGGGASLVAFDADNIYSGGAGIVHWNGTAWSAVEEFPSVIGPSIASISAVGLCDIWAVGRQIIAGDILNFSAHLQSGSIGGFTPSADINGDGHVNTDDLIMLITSWGPCPRAPRPCPADINGSGAVNTDDLIFLITHWG